MVSYNVTSNGNYAVEVSVGNCSDTSECVNMVSTGLIKERNENEIHLYPNPTSSIITIDFENIVNAHVTIFDLLGKEIYGDRQLNQHQLEVDLSNFVKGVYFSMDLCLNFPVSLDRR